MNVSETNDDGQLENPNDMVDEDERSELLTKLVSLENGTTRPDDDTILTKRNVYKDQTSVSFLVQMSIPFTIAGLGSTFAGIILSVIINRWPIFQQLPSLEVMIPAFIGLTGNIETTLASRLSTHANLGTMDQWNNLRDLVIGNVALVWCQALVTGVFAAVASILVTYVNVHNRKHVNMANGILLCASSMLTSVATNLILASFIIIVVMVARHMDINPDNISSPIAASMGDICSLSLLAIVTQTLANVAIDSSILLISIIFVLLMFVPLLFYIARSNRFTKSSIVTGWVAILSAIVVEQPGGLVMASAFERYPTISTIQPLVNGIGSNLVAIQTSRMSTYLHSMSDHVSTVGFNPKIIFFSQGINSRITRLLLFVLMPAHLTFIYLIYVMQTCFNFHLLLTPSFILVYSIAISFQMVILLYVAHVIVFWVWKHGINPDNSAIPFTSALADVLGNVAMAIAFRFLASIHDPNAINVSLSSSPPSSTFQ